MHLTPAPEQAPLSVVEQVAAVALVVVAAVGAVLATGSPTGVPAADAGWRAVGAGIVTLAALRARPAARMVPALVATAVGAATQSWEVAGAALVVLAGTAVAPVTGRWRAPASAALVAAGVQLLFRLPSMSPDPITTVLGVGAATSVVLSGWRGLEGRTRRWAARGAVASAGLLVVASAPFVVAGALAWGDVGRGTGEANAWRVATAEGDDLAASAHLDAASRAFERASNRVDGWWVGPASVVPLVGHHVEAARVGVRSGLRLVGSAEDVLAVADPQELKVHDGRLDLDRVHQVGPPLDDGRRTLATVEEDLSAVETRWLLPFVQHDLSEVLAQVREARDDADLAARVIDVLPGLLGGDGPRRYFVVFSSPAETRELGGFLGNWGLLTAVDGKLHLEKTGRAGDLNILSAERGATLSDPASFPARYVQSSPGEFWQNVTSSPDLPTVARAVADLYGQATGEAIDGVLVVDPLALQALLALTGPVEVPDLAAPLSEDNAADFLLRDQYRELPDLAQRVDFLSTAADATFDRLTSGDLPGPSLVAATLGPEVAGRHLLFWPLAPDAQPLMRELGLDGSLPEVDGDVLAVARANGGPNKLDAYLREELRYDVEVDEATGAVHSTLMATYTNEAPPGLPPYVSSNQYGLPEGTSRVLVSVWTPYLSGGASIDGVAASLERQVELGRNRYLTYLTIPRGASVTLELHLEGQLPADGYRLTVVRQPLSRPSDLEVTVHDPRGAPIRDGLRTTVIGG